MASKERIPSQRRSRPRPRYSIYLKNVFPHLPENGQRLMKPACREVSLLPGNFEARSRYDSESGHPHYRSRAVRRALRVVLVEMAQSKSIGTPIRDRQWRGESRQPSNGHVRRQVARDGGQGQGPALPGRGTGSRCAVAPSTGFHDRGDASPASEGGRWGSPAVNRSVILNGPVNSRRRSTSSTAVQRAADPHGCEWSLPHKDGDHRHCGAYDD